MATNILIRMPNWLGDAVMAAPVIEDIKKTYPDATLTLMCQGKVGDLFLCDPFADEIFTFNKPKGWLHRLHNRTLNTLLQKGNYDTGILLTNSISTAWTFYRGAIGNRIGFEGNYRTPLLNHSISYPKDKKSTHHTLLYKELLKPLEITPSETLPKLYISDSEIEDAKQFLEKLGLPKKCKIIGINPGAAYGSAKCWLPERFIEVSEKLLSDPDVYILFFGDPGSAELVNSICSKLPNRVHNLAGKTTIRTLMAIIKLCNAFLTNDSGPMHIASALQVPLVALFGPTCDVRTGPLGTASIIHKRVGCSPCFLRTCPIDHRCMREISSNEAYLSLISLLEGKRVFAAC